jgi:hypothetical protein
MNARRANVQMEVASITRGQQVLIVARAADAMKGTPWRYRIRRINAEEEMCGDDVISVFIYLVGPFIFSYQENG